MDGNELTLEQLRRTVDALSYHNREAPTFTAYPWMRTNPVAREYIAAWKRAGGRVVWTDN